MLVKHLYYKTNIKIDIEVSKLKNIFFPTQDDFLMIFNHFNPKTPFEVEK